MLPCWTKMRPHDVVKCQNDDADDFTMTNTIPLPSVWSWENNTEKENIVSKC